MSDIAIIFHFLSGGAAQVFKLILAAGGISLVIGLIGGVIQYFRIPIIKQLFTVYIFAMRGVPPLVLLSITFFSLNVGSPMNAAIIALSLYHGGYMMEIVRGGIEAIPEGQFEAADSIALTTKRKMWTVILPQIWNSILPPITGQLVLVIKTTALVSVIGVMGLISSGRSAIRSVGYTVPIYLLVALFFIIMCFTLEQISNALES